VTWWREPVLHFMLLGGVFFAVDGVFSESEERPLVIPDATRAALVDDFGRRTGRAPDAAETAVLVDGWLDEEILFREGRRLGLERGDPIVRRRVIQRMKALQRTMYPVEIPEDAALQAWMDAHPDRYLLVPRATFEHVFSSARHLDAKQRARTYQQEMVEGDAPGALGDPFPHGQREASMAISEVERQFGPRFAEVVSRASLGKWTLAPSEFGWHVVRVNERDAGGAATLEDAREAVEQDWMAEQERRIEGEALLRLREAAGL